MIEVQKTTKYALEWVEISGVDATHKEKQSCAVVIPVRQAVDTARVPF